MNFARFLATFLILVTGLTAVALPASAIDRVENTASLSFTTRGENRSVASNTTVLNVSLSRMPTVLKFFRMPAGFDYSDLTCQAAPPAIHGAAISEAQLATMKEDNGVSNHSLGVVLWDAPGNKNPNVRETEIVHGRASTGQEADLILTETGVDTGVFAGGFSSTHPTARAQACLPVMPGGTTFSVTFMGDDGAMSSTDSTLIDPYGHVFDSETGIPVNGAIVTLINVATGLPAEVYGDDGITRYPSVVTSGQNVTDAGGNLYVMDEGHYRFPLVAPGRYKLRVVAPHHASPSLVAPSDIPEGPEGAYTIIDASYEREFDLYDPEPLRVDIPVDPLPHGTLMLEKTTAVREASPGDLIPYLLHITNVDDHRLREGYITDTLPAGLRYRKGSTRGTDEPEISNNGRTLIFSLPDILSGGALELRYVVDVLPSAPAGPATNRAVTWIPDSPASPEATATIMIKPLLMSAAMTVVGRVTDGGCESEGKGVANVRILLDDGTYVTTDRDGLYHFEGVRKGRHVVQLDVQSLGATYAPVTCHDDTRWAGSQISRFVEGDGGSLHRVDFVLKATGKGAEIVEEKLPVKIVPSDIAAGGRTQWLIGQTPGIDWLFPEVDHNPRAPALRVAIKHASDQRIALTVNGKTTDPLAFDGTDKDGDVAVSVWTGLPLLNGDNQLQARVLDGSGAVVTTLTRIVHFSNTPLVATYVADKSRLIADGKTRPMIAVRLTDRDGKPVRDGTMAAYRLEQPYMAAITSDMDQNRQLAGLDRAEAFVRVTGDDGLAFIILQPTTQAGQARIIFTLSDGDTQRKSEVRPWLETGAQDWVVVGFGAGTVGFDTLSKNTRRYWMPKNRDLMTNGQVSLYAKGRIKGSWLLTLAYDSDRSYDPTTGLLSNIDPDRYYTVYGDGSRQAYDAATSRKLYLRLERKDAFLMAGDFETGFKDTQLTRFNRTLNGVKAGYHNDRVTATAFAARSDQRYARDEIQGNGLSGPYRLTAEGLVPNTDKITIETRDRFRPEKIIDSKPLTRHVDYDIDAGNGTLSFREPILSRDADLNPVFIVVDYEVDVNAGSRLVAGARVVARLTDKIEVGATVLKDEGEGNANLAGIDLKAKLTDTTELRAEAAQGGRENAGDNAAYLIEVEHHGAKSDVLAYARQQDDGFGLGQQNFGEAGKRKVGIDARTKLTDKLSLIASAWRQEALTSTDTRMAGTMKLERRTEAGTLFTEVTSATDEGETGQQTSRLLTLGGSRDFLDHKLQLNGQVQYAVGDADDNMQFPVRNAITAAYRISDSVRLIAGHETAEGAGVTANTSRIGFDLKPWHGAKLATTLNQLAIGENGTRSFAQFGLSQSLDVGKHWTLDATLDASHTLSGALSQDAVNPFQPITAGTALNTDRDNGQYTSATLGATYRAALWSWNGRIEARQAELSRRYGLTSNVVRTLGEGKIVASSLRLYTIRDSQGRQAELGSTDISLAWRPLDSHWSVLQRLELRHNRADAGVIGANILGMPISTGENQVTTRLINNTALNYRSDLRDGEGDQGSWGIEASVYYGAKLIRGKLANDAYDGFIDTIGFDIRKSLGKRFDVAFALSQQTAHESKVKSLSYGPSIGYSPKKDVWVSAGYNISGYHDPDADGRYTEQGAYVTVRVKFDQSSLSQSALGKMFR